MLPSGFEPIGVSYALNSRCADESGQCPGSVRAARESKNVNFVVRHKVRDYGFINILNDLLESETDHASQQLVEQIALDSHAIVIVDMLGNAICGGGFDKGLPRG